MLSKFAFPLFIIFCVAALVILRGGTIVVLLALLPSIVAWYFDNQPGKLIFKSVLACNLAGFLPTLINMLEAGLGFKTFDLIPAIKHARLWFIIYAGAAAGWCLVYLCGFIARIFLLIEYERRIASLERLQKRLLDEWGQKILPETPKQ